MSKHRTVRTSLLAAAITATLLASGGQALVQAAEADAPAAVPAALAAGRQAPVAAPVPNPFDEVQHLAKAPTAKPAPAPAPGGLTAGRVAGPQTKLPAAAKTAKGALLAPAATTAGVPCTLDGITGLGPEQFADFLADPAVTANVCLRTLIWTWDARLAPVMSDAHVQAVARRISARAAAHDGRNGSNLEEMFTYLHAVAYHDFARAEIDITDAPTVDAIRRAIADFGNAARTFDATATNANTLREALYAGTAPGLRQHSMGMAVKVLATMGPDRPATNRDENWGKATLSALSLNYLGIYPGNQDAAFHTAVRQDASYRAAFKALATYGHLKDTVNAWVVRDGMKELGRFGQVDGLRDAAIADLGWALGQMQSIFGRGSEHWTTVASWIKFYDACRQFSVCREDVEAWLFPNAYTYDNGAIKVRTALDRATVDQLYYASKRVKAQFHRVVGTDQPLAGDPNTTLNIVLYASRADYVNLHPLLTGMGTANGGVYIERGATFYTYQRRVPQDSSLTLEELFRHEYVHYLNGRFAVPGFFGEGSWYEGDRTTAMDEGTAEFFDGATRDDGIAVRKSLVKSIIADTAAGGPRMSIEQLLNATYAADGFRFYSYAGTFFEFLWAERPSLLQEMYRHLRADDPSGFDAWRNRLGADTYLQRDYNRFLDTQIAKVDQLFVPNTVFTPVGQLRDAALANVKSSFYQATASNPDCVENGAPGQRRFVCTGRITATLKDWRNTDQVFKDMSETVDYFILDRAGAVSNNLADMNCSFGPVDIWANRVAGTSAYSCDGPLRG